jgi:glucosamine--fructose-6-phosphate aminotransferase (isomerizing)
MDISEEDFQNVRSIKIAACGTSWHAGTAAKYMIEELARVPVEVDYASEFRYRNPVLDESDLLIVISQSGETADTIAAMREARAAGCKVLAICNVQGSMITREADGTILTHAGPEISVASTKAFTSQIIALYIFALYLGELRGKLSEEQVKKHAQELIELPLRSKKSCRTPTRSKSSRASFSARRIFSISVAASISRRARRRFETQRN